MRQAIGVPTNAASRAEREFFEARQRGDRAAMERAARVAFTRTVYGHARPSGTAPAGATTTSTAPGSKRGRPGATMAGDLAALNAVLAGATPRCTRSDSALPCDICGRDTLDVFGCQCDDD